LARKQELISTVKDPSDVCFMNGRDSSETQIGAAACPTCALCGATGEYLHRGLQDRLFNAQGLWNFKKCSNRECELVWLDPMPLNEEIWKAYANYYTHTDRNGRNEMGVIQAVYYLMKRGYWASKYNYPVGSRPFISRSLCKLLYLSPMHRREADAAVRCLPAVPQGRLLDVGCGSGEWLLEMRQRGWTVEGFDFDDSAVKLARQKGLKVECGSLEDRNYPADCFDAVTLNHVIEHVPDPVRTLVECARILKPEGKLVLFTPNNSSLGHLLFREGWRGLEPPRHLHIFSMKSLRRTLTAAGFHEMTILPFIVTSVIYESLLLRWGRTGFASGSPRDLPAWGITRLFKFLELCLLPWNPALGDCVIAVAVKTSRAR
jgi:2-polyprenyl-3-methyl-5-hydroxy-6-metoxy-1,4-benzoquinol methylase